MGIGRIELANNKKVFVPYQNIGKIEIIDGKKEYVPYTDANTGGCDTPIEDAHTSLDNVQDLVLKESNEKITITWKDPENVVFNGEVIGEWAGTKVVRKEGSLPKGIKDGILITDSKVKNQYTETGLEDNNTILNRTYNYALFPYTNKNIYTFSDLNRVSGSLLKYNPILAENTWQEIHEASISGFAKKTWKVGDEKDGFKILDFDHDDLADGTGKAGITFLSPIQPARNWDIAGNTGYIFYYKSSSIRSYLINNVFSALPESLAQVIKTVNKPSAIGTSTEITGIEVLEDKLFLLSYKEIAGSTLAANANQNEGNLYANARALIGNTTWTRTVQYTPYKTFIAVLKNGGLTGLSRAAELQYFYAFCI